MRILKLFLLLVMFCIGLISCNGGGSCSSSCNPPAPSPTGILVSLDSSNGGIADGAADVSLTPSIALKFSLVMNPSTINNSTIYLSTSPTLTSFAAKLHLQYLPSSVAISSINADQTYQIFTFNPLIALNQNTKYYVIITNGVKSASGSTVTGQFSFTTGTIASPTVSYYAR